MPRLGATKPLVGRADELATLKDGWGRAREARPGLVLVSGDAGVGKTRLLEELARRARADGGLVLVGRCLEAGESGLPYLPFVEALHGLTREAEQRALRSRPALARMLPHLDVEATAGDDELGRLPLFADTHGLLAEVAAMRPVLLVLEDLHWADQSTRDLLSFLAARLRAEPLLVVASYRAEDLHRRHPLRALLAELVRLPVTERVHVPPLLPGEADRFVRLAAAGLPRSGLARSGLAGSGLARSGLGDAALRRIADRSEGNAFLAEELLAAYVDSADEDLPPSLADVLLTRLEQLPGPVRQVVRVAAVGGRRVQHGRLQQVAGLADDELDDALRGAVDHHILVSDTSGEGYLFRHALMQEAVYADLLPGQRTRWHAGYAAALTGETGHGAAAELAHHSLAAGDQPTALRASVTAAAEAMKLGAPAEALRHLETALRLWSAVPEPERATGTDEIQLMMRAGHAASAGGDPERALAHLRAASSAVDGAAAPLTAGEVGWMLTRQLIGLDRAGEAYRAATDALARLGERTGEPVWAKLLVEQATAAFGTVDWPRVRALSERAERAARDLALPASVAEALATRALVSHQQGDVQAADGLYQEAASIAATAGASNARLRALFHHALMQFEYDRAVEGLATVDCGLTIAERAGLTWSTFGLELRVLQVLIRATLGDWDGAECAADVTTGSVSSLVEARVVAAVVWVAIGRGRFDEAEQLLARVARHRDADIQITLLLALCEAELHLWRDDPEQTVAVVDAMLARLADDGVPMAFMGIRLCALALAGLARPASRARSSGDETGLRALLATADRLHEHAAAVLSTDRPGGRPPGPEARAWAAVAEAEHARVYGRDDPEVWARAAELFGYGAVYEQARCFWRQAGALLLRGDRDAAAEPLERALRTAEKLGAEPLLQAARRLADRAGLGSSPAAPVVPAGADPLTSREREVLRQVARGLTNRQIGAELFISEKTVSVHLSRVMAKLGATGRTEAVSLAYTRGLLDPVGA